MRYLNILAAVILIAVAADAQTVRLVQAETGATDLEISVGDVIDVDIVIDFEGSAVSGAVVFLSMDDAFLVAHNGRTGESGTQPFIPGPLFESEPITNLFLPESDPVAAQLSGFQLDFGTILSESDAPPNSSGVLASIRLLAVKPAADALLLIDDNPIRETRFILDDQRSEARFRSASGMQVRVVPTATAVTAKTWGELKLRAD